MSDELRELDSALCNLLNGAFDPYGPVDLWRDEIWNAMSVVARAYNKAHEAQCFPKWRSPVGLPEKQAFRNWQNELRSEHGRFRMMVLSDENGRPISAEALSKDGKPISSWERPAPFRAPWQRVR